MPGSESHRLSDPCLLILSSLAGGAKHGYAIREDIERFAGLRLGPGTLYGAPARLEMQQLVAPLPTKERRRPYRLTGQGMLYLQEHLTGLERLANLGLRRLASL